VSELRRFRNELSVNHVTDSEYTLEARTYISGAAEGCKTHRQIASAVGELTWKGFGCTGE
jgi:hypothetical protein